MTEQSTVRVKLEQERGESRILGFVRRARRSPNVIVGTTVLSLVIILVVLAPVLSPFDPIEQFRRERLMGPSATHYFGTDNLGRDIFARVLFGGRISLQVGIISVSIASLGGTFLGLISGYYGRWLDSLIMRLIDVLLSFPSILLALAIVAVLGRDLRNVMLAVGIATLPIYTRVVRASTLSVKEIDYITAARALGAPAWRILFFHILPNVLAPIIVVSTNGIAGAIIAGAALSFLGVGAQPPTPEWGLMLSQGQEFLRVAWWVTTFPGLAIMVTVLGINLLGDGLRDILDPRLKI
ncbi:MAG: ABC transporter permease [Chloroflexi bacterium]|nr:MAG: ABC transporter permease [Chloroflexota bacterium]